MKRIPHPLLIAWLWFSCSDPANIEIIATPVKVTIKHGAHHTRSENDAQMMLWDKQKQVTTLLVGGKFQTKSNDLIFTPNFRLLENTDYALVINKGKQVHTFQTQKGPGSPPAITSIYPTSDTLPENLLRMYISFSQPMKPVGNLEQIRLLNVDNQEIQGAIFNNVYELWDASQQQLTLIFDPARVKSGLVAHENLGRALQPGGNYTIIIDSLEDIHGKQITRPYLKSFFVKQADITSPDMELWDIIAPTSGTQKGLKVVFSQTIDKMSLLHRIIVLNEEQVPIRGSITFRENETLWVFQPDEPWLSGHYTLAINSRLADPSGNNLNGLFDHEIGSLMNEPEGIVRFLKFEVD